MKLNKYCSVTSAVLFSLAASYSTADILMDTPEQAKFYTAAQAHHLPLDFNSVDLQRGKYSGPMLLSYLPDYKFDGYRMVANFEGDNYIRMHNLTGSTFTLSAWIKTDTETLTSDIPHGHGNALFWADIAGVGNDMIISLVDNSLSFMEGSKAMNTDTHTRADVDVVDNKWHHIAVVRDGDNGTVTLYVDGYERAINETGNNILGDSNYIYIGYNPLDEGRNFTGLMDDVRIHDIALPADKIHRMYTDPSYGWAKKIYTPTPADTISQVGKNLALHAHSYDENKQRYSSISYEAINLPDGLRITQHNGSITGTPTKTGTYYPEITATTGDGLVKATYGFIWTIVE